MVQGSGAAELWRKAAGAGSGANSLLIKMVAGLPGQPQIVKPEGVSDVGGACKVNGVLLIDKENSTTNLPPFYVCPIDL